MEDSADNPFARSELNGRQAFIRRFVLTVAVAVTPFNLKGGGVSLDFLKPLFEAILDSFQNLGMNKVQITGNGRFFRSEKRGDRIIFRSGMGVGEADRDGFFRNGIPVGKLAAELVAFPRVEAGPIDGYPD